MKDFDLRKYLAEGRLYQEDLTEDISKFNSAFKLLQQSKPLNTISNKVMADTFVALMKNSDEALNTKFRAAFKKIN